MRSFGTIFKALNKAKVRYLVVGGVAVNLHGIERSTADLDLVVYLEKPNLIKFCQVMSRLGFQPKVPVKAEDFSDPHKRQDWIKNKNMIVFSFIHSKEMMEIIDVFAKHPLPFEDIFKHHSNKRAFGTPVPIMSMRDLITLKKRAGRPKDLYDLSYLHSFVTMKTK